MGRTKATLRLGSRSLLGHVRAAAQRLAVPVRVIRHDLRPGCGPLGGIYTALTTSRAAGILFLSCDMPFVSTALLREILRGCRARSPALFVEGDHGVGFPLALQRTCLPAVKRQLDRNEWALRDLARALRARTVRLTPRRLPQLFNVNTPEDLEQARNRKPTPRKHALSSRPGRSMFGAC